MDERTFMRDSCFQKNFQKNVKKKIVNLHVLNIFQKYFQNKVKQKQCQKPQE